MSVIQGERGVIEVLELLKQELQLAMALSGNTHKGNNIISPVRYNLCPD